MWTMAMAVIAAMWSPQQQKPLMGAGRQAELVGSGDVRDERGLASWLPDGYSDELATVTDLVGTVRELDSLLAHRIALNQARRSLDRALRLIEDARAVEIGIRLPSRVPVAAIEALDQFETFAVEAEDDEPPAAAAPEQAPPALEPMVATVEPVVPTPEPTLLSSLDAATIFAEDLRESGRLGPHTDKSLDALYHQHCLQYNLVPVSKERMRQELGRSVPGVRKVQINHQRGRKNRHRFIHWTIEPAAPATKVIEAEPLIEQVRRAA